MAKIALDHLVLYVGEHYVDKLESSLLSAIVQACELQYL